jgi:hypothetical protein
LSNSENEPPAPATGGEEEIPEKKETATVAAQLTDEELAQVRAVLQKLAEPDPPAAESKTEASVEEPEFTDEELDEIAQGIDEVEAEEADLVAASHETQEALELANARIDAQSVELARLRAERDQERYEAEKTELASKFGIPADVTELARPLLLGSEHTVELSNGKQVDAGAVMRKVLHELGRRYAKALDFSAEYGTAEAPDESERRQRENEQFFAQADRVFGRKGV